MRLYLIVLCKVQGLQQQQKHRERALSLKRFRTTSLPAACTVQDCNGIIHQGVETVAHELHRNRHAAVQALMIVRQCVSQGVQAQESYVLELVLERFSLIARCACCFSVPLQHKTCHVCPQTWRELWTCSFCHRE